LQRRGYVSHARDVFTQVLRSAEGAPRHYVKMQREWIDIARANTAPLPK
jgi:hypothetical protein